MGEQGPERVSEQTLLGLEFLTVPGRHDAVRQAAAAMSGSAAALSRSLAELTALSVGAPVVLASLLDDEQHQVVLGAHGLDGLAPGTVTAVQYSQCLKVTEMGLPLIVTDVRQDGRPGAVPGLRDDEVGSYAGFPLRGDAGQVLGALCIVDPQPRQWTPRELEILDRTAQLLNTALTDRNHDNHEHHTGVHAGQAFLTALLDSLETGVAACDADGRLVIVNRSLRRLAVQEPEAAPQERWIESFDCRHPDGRPFVLDEMPLMRALRGEQVRGVEQLAGPPGRERHVLVNGHPISGPGGQRLGAVCAVHDISDRRRAERLHACEVAVSYALAEARDTGGAGRAVLEATGTALGWAHAELWLVDAAADVLTCAARWTAPDAANGEPVHVPATIARGQGLAGTAWHTGQAVWEPDTTAPGSTLSSASVESGRLRAALALPMRSGERIVGVLAFFAAHPQDRHDPALGLLSGIAAHLGHYLQRRRAEDLQLELSRSKDDYLNLVGHELRTPLTVIGTYLELIGEAEPDAPAGEILPMVAVAQRASDRLRRLVEALLDLSQLDAGRIGMARVPVDMSAVVEAAANDLGAAAASRNVRLQVRLPEEAPVVGDAKRLGQMAGALLDNAVTYTPEGGAVTAVLTQDAAGTHLSVTDTGYGIPEDERPHVFERFYRGAVATEHSIPGAGLGLAIAQLIAQRHLGHITVAPADASKAPETPASPDGTKDAEEPAGPPGTTFTIHLPAAAGD